MIRAMFFDLDGTLLTSAKQISEKTLQALKDCKNAGVKLFVATARPPLLQRMFGWGAGLFDGGTYQNGSCTIVGGQKGYRTISDETVINILALALRFKDVNIAFQLEDEKHAFRYPLDENGYKAWGVSREEVLKFDSAMERKVVKLILFYSNLVDSNTMLDEMLVSAATELCLGKAQCYITDVGKTLMITGIDANKLRSVEEIYAALGLARDEIAVFGDDTNDIEMLAAHRYSFAMGNANEEVKRAAAYCVPDNDSDGIADAIGLLQRLKLI